MTRCLKAIGTRKYFVSALLCIHCILFETNCFQTVHCKTVVGSAGWHLICYTGYLFGNN